MVLPDRPQMTGIVCACAFYAGHPRLQTHPQNMYYVTFMQILPLLLYMCQSFLRLWVSIKKWVDL